MQFQDFMRGFNWGNQPADKKDDDKQNGHGQPKQPRAPAVQHAPEPQPNMFQEHAAMQADMYKATNEAWHNEMDSRVTQAREARKQDHEYNLELLRQQGESERAYAQQQQGFGGGQGLSDPARQARNRTLLSMAGMGGHTIHSDGHGNTTVWPHPYGQSPIARSLLG